jgi:hypothetical protein
MAKYLRKTSSEEAVRIVAVARNEEGEPDHSCFSEYPDWLQEAIYAGVVSYSNGPLGPRIAAPILGCSGLEATFGVGDFVLLRGGVEAFGVPQDVFERLYEACG